MPQAIGPIIAAAQAAYGAAVSVATSAAFALGAGKASLVVGTAAVNLSINAAVSGIASLAFRPQIPDSAFARGVRKQAIPDRVSGYGRVLVGGDYMLWEAKGNYAYIVLAQLDGLSDGVETLYLNDRVATVSGGYVQQGDDQRYGNSDLVQIAYRNGLPTETRYSEITDTTLWPTDARGDGVASLMMIAKAAAVKNFLRDYPNGLPIPRAVRRAQLCWDPRLGARGTITSDADKLASATWQWTDNPVLALLDYKTAGSGGPGFDISRFIPRIDDWIASADVCDELVDLKGGGTEKRYTAGGAYTHSTADADVTATLLASFDGWFGQDIDGNFTVQAGVYYEPTVTITAEHIINMDVSQGKRDEECTNEISASYTDPLFDYTEVETDPLRDEANIALIGVDRSQKLSLPWVQSGPQAQRLRKIALKKSGQSISGTITTTLDGLRAWGERRIRIQCDPSESEAMSDIVVDIQQVTLNADFTVTIPFVSCDPTMYDWDAEEEQGDGAGEGISPELEPIPTPSIASITVFVDSGSSRLRIYPTGAAAGETYVARWKVTGAIEWVEEPSQVVGTTYIETSPIPSASIDVQVAYVTAGGSQSDWSATSAADATVTIPDPVIGLSATGGVTIIDVEWINPVPPSFDHARVWYAITGTAFGSATDDGTVSGTPGASETYQITALTAGVYDVWVAAENAANQASAPTGPVTVTVT